MKNAIFEVDKAPTKNSKRKYSEKRLNSSFEKMAESTSAIFQEFSKNVIIQYKIKRSFTTFI